MTTTNKRFFQMELENFEKYLLFDELNEEAWQALTRESKHQDLLLSILIVFMIGIAISIIVSVVL